MNSRLYNNYRSRIKTLFLLIMVLNIFFLIEIFNIQIFNHDKYTEILAQETIRVSKKTGARGKILDINQNRIADNIERFDFWVNTTSVFNIYLRRNA